MQLAVYGVGSLLAALIVLYVVLMWSSRPSARHCMPTGRARRALEVGGISLRSVQAFAWAKACGFFVPARQRRALTERAHRHAAQQACEALGNMKGVLMKFGQILSFAVDDLPDAYPPELARLQREAPPMAYSVVRDVVAAELGEAPERLFRSFAREPAAAASIGQVHRAVLPDGTPVAVKVQYPGVDKAIRSDLDNAALMTSLSKLLSPGRDTQSIVNEMRDRVLEELDYTIEADNQARFHELYEGHPFVLVPSVHREFSSRRVLTTDWVDGASFDEVCSWPEPERSASAEKIYRFVFDSMHRYRMFNGDPHPGNYLFCADGRVAFVDFGCVKFFTPEQIENLLDFSRELHHGDPVRFRELLEEQGFLAPGFDAHFSDEELYKFFATQWAPVLIDDEVTLTLEWAHSATINPFDVAGPMKYLQPPPGQLFLVRINVGLNAIFARLGATLNWHRLEREYTDGDAPHTPIGRIAHDWRDGRGLHVLT